MKKKNEDFSTSVEMTRLFKRKQQIREEVPQRRRTDGEDLAEVEVPFEFIGKDVKC